MATAKDKVLFEKGGVFIHTTVVASTDEDALVAGKVLIVQKANGLYIEWQMRREDEGRQGDSEWDMVDTVGYKTESNVSPSHDSVTVHQPNKTPTPHKYVINFDITDLKSFKRSKPKMGWSYLIFILKDGTTYPALHFHEGGTKLFIRELEKHLIVKKSPNDSCLYLVRQHDPGALSKSFDELQLFGEQSTHVLNKFIHDPVNTTLGGFSRVTGFLVQQLMTEPQHTAQLDPRHVSHILQHDNILSSQDDQGFEVLTARDLPPRPDVHRLDPISPQRWSYHMDQEGRVQDLDELLHAIFKGGVEPTIRIEVWKFLLGYYKWDSTYGDRMDERKNKVDRYFAMKLQWKSVDEEQETRFSIMRDRKNLIDKDVTRTDRTHPFFQGENNPNLSVLYDILMTYCMYNFDLGYVQGMSDLCAPIMVVMENEVDAFWCFAGFMDIIGPNFEMDQAGMKDQLRQLNLLLQFIDPQLHNHLDSHESSNMYFCFRWLLIIFKREFSFPEIMRLWEVFWTGKPCKNFQLFICLAILEMEKNTLIDNNFGFTEILKHINDMSGSIPLEDILIRAEAIYRQLAACKILPPSIADIIQIKSPDSTDSSSISSSPEKQAPKSPKSLKQPPPKRPPPPGSAPPTLPGASGSSSKSGGRQAPGRPERVVDGPQTRDQSSSVMAPHSIDEADELLNIIGEHV